MSSSLKEQKQTLRKRVLEKRNQIPEGSWLDASKRIIRSLMDTDIYQQAKVIHTYISMNSRREVSTDILIEEMFARSKRVVVPVTDFKTNTLSHTEINSATELKENKWGVKEPKDQEEFDISELDMVIIPMAAADRNGNRLGYGQGFYDRFLSKTEAKKIGLVFSNFLFDTIPVEEFDKKLDVIITEEEVIFA